MKNLSEVFSNIKERISNPFIFSFICAWLIANWHIVFAILSYDEKPLDIAHINAFINYMNDKISNEHKLLTPIIAAIAYTILIPLMRAGIKIFYSWIDKSAENTILSLNKDGKVPMDKYIKLRAIFQERQEKLEKIIGEESNTIGMLNESRVELSNAQVTINKLDIKLSNSNNDYRASMLENETLKESNNKLAEELRVISRELNQLIESTNISLLNGFWECQYPYPGNTITEEIYIDNGKYHIIDNQGRRHYVFDIVKFHYNMKESTISFIKDRKNLDVLYRTTVNPANPNSVGQFEFKYLINNL